MDYTLDWGPQYVPLLAGIACLTFGFTAYHFISHTTSIKERWQHLPAQQQAIRWVLFQKYTGFVFMGVLPLVVMLAIGQGPASFGVKAQFSMLSTYWVLGLAAIIIPMNFFAARKPVNLKQYPQIRVNEWNGRLLVANAMGWISYLLGYEFLFRGVFLFTTYQALGAWPAILLNASVYAIAHIPKGLRETIGAIPLGLLLCVITLNTGTIWVAFLVHVTLALSNDFWSIAFHPEMKYKL